MASTLILYDTTGAYGWLGEIYAIMTANLASRFGSWTAEPVANYTAGQMTQFTATIYIGSTYGEPIPSAFLADVQTNQNKPVVWIFDNIWQLVSATPGFQTNYGWTSSVFDTSAVAQVNYKGQQLKRYAANGSGIMTYVLNTTGTVPMVLATAVRSDGTTFPWALRSKNLTYIGEIPFMFMTEGDRYLAFCDLLFDALAPSTATTRRALLRIEDISPFDDPTPLYDIADYLSGLNVRFGFQIIPLFADPAGYYNGGVPQTIHLKDTPDLLDAMAYLQASGGELLAHGYTHQYTQTGQTSTANPYTGVSGDDAEFYRLTLNGDQSVNYVDPVAEDSTTWATNRITAMNSEFTAAFAQDAFVSAGYNTSSGYPYNGSVATLPTVWTAPNYAGSAADYKVFSTKFSKRSERSLYFKGLLSGGAPDPTHMAGQYMPYVIPKDVYGGKVLPDTLGGIEPQAFGVNPARLPADILADAQRNLAVRDAWASFFFHASDWDTTNQYLQTTVQGLLNLGYTFQAFSSL